MELRGIDFGSVWGASGVQGFFGEGYIFHKFWKPFGLDFRGMTFVSKTATLFSREGNMPLVHGYEPTELLPSCIKTHIRDGNMLNAVGLSNPGLGMLLGLGEWQKIEKPFFISLMATGETPERRLKELSIMGDMLASKKHEFKAQFGIQINLSCPNTGHDTKELITESLKAVDALWMVGAPLVLKYSIATAPIKAIMELQKYPGCDGICVSNSVPFGWDGIDWKKVWGSDVSPLAPLGGGALSGKALKPLVCDWIARLRDAGFEKHINGGGGIMSPEDVNDYSTAGADSVFIGSAAALRPWRVKDIIRRANRIMKP